MIPREMLLIRSRPLLWRSRAVDGLKKCCGCFEESGRTGLERYENTREIMEVRAGSSACSSH